MGLGWALGKEWAAITALGQTKDPLNPEATISGTSALLTDFHSEGLGSLSFLVLPQGVTLQSPVGARIAFLPENGTYSAAFVHKKSEDYVLGTFQQTWDSLTLYGEGQLQLQGMVPRGMAGVSWDLPWPIGDTPPTLAGDYLYNGSPDHQGGIGNRETHYWAVELKGVALTDVTSVDSTFIRSPISGYYAVLVAIKQGLTPSMGLSVEFDQYGTLSPGQPSELDLVSYRHQISLKVATVF